MTYLVTGAYGALGAWVVRALLDREQEVVTYDLGGSDHRLRLALTGDELDGAARGSTATSPTSARSSG